MVVIPSTIACGYCSYCCSGYHSQCDNSNPNGSSAGTAFFGGPAETGFFNGLQAEYARIPFANACLLLMRIIAIFDCVRDTGRAHGCAPLRTCILPN
ncbi:alcohol dehydrogenase catalytic domain-containing protein [Scytonema millei]|uniref:alcohol dehydrogenase catalytic domain-containing protein n=1 Tax=Scytonema millei TaxID=1245922 RepID=UPI000B0BFAFF|nr:alcohol dehydrogenase catalytic domain-containing protein [Scytonema millei]